MDDRGASGFDVQRLYSGICVHPVARRPGKARGPSSSWSEAGSASMWTLAAQARRRPGTILAIKGRQLQLHLLGPRRATSWPGSTAAGQLPVEVSRRRLQRPRLRRRRPPRLRRPLPPRLFGVPASAFSRPLQRLQGGVLLLVAMLSSSASRACRNSLLSARPPWPRPPRPGRPQTRNL